MTPLDRWRAVMESGLRGSEKHVAIAVAYRDGCKGRGCTASVATLADDAGIGVKAARRALQSLTRAGMVQASPMGPGLPVCRRLDWRRLALDPSPIDQGDPSPIRDPSPIEPSSGSTPDPLPDRPLPPSPIDQGDPSPIGDPNLEDNQEDNQEENQERTHGPTQGTTPSAEQPEPDRGSGLGLGSSAASDDRAGSDGSGNPDPIEQPGSPRAASGADSGGRSGAVAGGALSRSEAWQRIHDLHRQHDPRAVLLSLRSHGPNLDRCAKRAGTSRRPDYDRVVDAWRLLWTHPVERWDREVDRTPARLLMAFLRPSNGFARWLTLLEEWEASGGATGAPKGTQAATGGARWLAALETAATSGPSGVRDLRVRVEARDGGRRHWRKLCRAMESAGISVAWFRSNYDDKGTRAERRARFVALMDAPAGGEE